VESRREGFSVTKEYTGLLLIGDPHLASRVPGFRKDDYPRTIFDKLAWALEYAAEHRLLPAILGDLFHWPRDNSNRLLVQLLDLLDGSPVGIAGNHDCKENELGEDDSLWILKAAGHLRLLDHSGPWQGNIDGRTVIVGGTPWGQKLPTSFDKSVLARDDSESLVIWLTHHDVTFPGYDEIGRIVPHEIPGIDIVVNGHIHRPLDDVIVGTTTWVNPGNIARVRRSDADRSRRPNVLRLDIRKQAWHKQTVEVPFLPHDDVFHKEIDSGEIRLDESMFVKGLATLESLRTHGGAGLREFLDQNLGQFDPRVAAEIRVLAEEVCSNEGQQQ
jgi:predicted phosphodiesterase